MTESEINFLLSIPKSAVRWTGWVPRSNHAGTLVGTAELVDSNSIAIPGVTLQLEVKEAVAVNSCLYLFSVMHFSRHLRSRIYQLEVAPEGKRTHNGASPIYGPHEHKGSSEATAVRHPDVHCESWGRCVTWFLTRVSVAPFALSNPFEP